MSPPQWIYPLCVTSHIHGGHIHTIVDISTMLCLCCLDLKWIYPPAYFMHVWIYPYMGGYIHFSIHGWIYPLLHTWMDISTYFFILGWIYPPAYVDISTPYFQIYTIDYYFLPS